MANAENLNSFHLPCHSLIDNKGVFSVASYSLVQEDKYHILVREYVLWAMAHAEFVSHISAVFHLKNLAENKMFENIGCSGWASVSYHNNSVYHYGGNIR